MAPHTCNSKTRQDEAGREFKVIMTLHSQFQDSLGYMKSCLNKTKQSNQSTEKKMEGRILNSEKVHFYIYVWFVRFYYFY